MATPVTAITVSDYMHKPEHLASFSDMLGKDTEAYVQSVLILVSGDQKLRECTPESVYKAALRAASLGLSCDPATKQAWLIPYNKNIGTRDRPQWVKEAQFQPHYLGLYNLAMRTGKYWIINVSPVYEGQRVLENPLTGLHAVVESNGFVGEPKAYNAAYMVDVTNRRTKDMKVIGWIGYFKAKKGNEKSVWMSIAEIEDHAQKYVKDYEKNQNWHDADKRLVMEKKTVLRKLLAWADLSGSESAKLAEALQADQVEAETEIVDSLPPEEVTESPSEPETPKEPEVEMCDPTNDQAVGYAAHTWNIAPAKVRKEIAQAIEAGKIQNPMAKAEFKKWVANPQGEPQGVPA